MRERDIERYLVQRVKEAGGLCRKVRWIGVNGAPDRVVILPAPMKWKFDNFDTIWVELKAPGKKPEPHQLAQHELLRRYGQNVVVIDSIAGADDLFLDLA